jgi:hypothetical protein
MSSSASAGAAKAQVDRRRLLFGKLALTEEARIF